MALKPITTIKADRIVANLLAACKEINDLSKDAYDFINISSGFIAHYNWHGFIKEYHKYSLRDDILDNQSNNQYDNFQPDDENYEYYMQKQHMYNRVCEGLKADTEFTFNSAVAAKYIRVCGVSCPKCGGYNITGRQVEIDSGIASQDVGCDTCDSSWTDVYELKSIANFMEG